jgi:two-component system, NarL family, nitrate/nitrite response regulator NarL
MGGTMRLVLCDDNLILDEALAPALTACGHQVVAITTSPAAGVAAVREQKPDACLLDPRSPDEKDGLAAVRAIRLRQPDTAVVILASAPAPSVVGEARKLGVAGFLSKDQNVAQIVRALDIVASGGTAFESAPSCRARATAPQRSDPPYELTPRETEVLRRIVAGQGTVQMADEMNIAASTLRTYVKNLLSKLGTHSRLQAAALASREGLVAESPA